MAIPSPGRRFKWLTAETFVYDVAIALVAFGSSAAGAVKWFAESLLLGWAMVLCAVLTLLAVMAKAIVQRRQQRAKESPSDLEGCLHVLRSVLLMDVSLTRPDPQLRITIHLPTPDGSHLEQAVEYVGNNRGGSTKGRKFKSGAGIIGRCYRERKNELYIGVRTNDDPTAFIDELVSVWGYDREDARRLDPESKTWLALPLLDSSSNVQAILYADSTDRKFFTQDRQTRTMAVAGGIAAYVARRYT